MATKSISQLDAAAVVTVNDLFETAIQDSGSVSGYTSKKHSMAAIASFVNTEVNFPTLNTTAKAVVAAINEIVGIVLTGTLTAGQTTITLYDAGITTSSTIEAVYTSVDGVNPTSRSIATGSVTLTFLTQASDIQVKVRIT